MQTSTLKKPIVIFIILVLFLLCLFFLFPINLFSGEIVIKEGLVEVVEQRPLSLSYFIGLGYDESDMDIIKDFYLLPQGYLTAVIFILGIPGLVAYRVYLKRK
jgi:hypothetical protein